MIEDFLTREDRIRHTMSQGELERRWTAVRERMADRKVDYLVVQSQNRYVGSYFRWFTDIPGTNFSISVVFPKDDDMTIITHGPQPPTPPPNPPKWAWRGVKETFNLPFFPNVYWADSWQAEV